MRKALRVTLWVLAALSVVLLVAVIVLTNPVKARSFDGCH